MHDPVRAVFDRFASAWDAHDAHAMADCWVETGNAVHPWGKFAAGRAEIESMLRDEHQSTMAASHYEILSLATREVANDAVVVEGEAVIESALAPSGRAYTLPHRFDAVVVRSGERWLFMSLHPSFH